MHLQSRSAESVEIQKIRIYTLFFTIMNAMVKDSKVMNDDEVIVSTLSVYLFYRIKVFDIHNKVGLQSWSTAVLPRCSPFTVEVMFEFIPLLFSPAELILLCSVQKSAFSYGTSLVGWNDLSSFRVFIISRTWMKICTRPREVQPVMKSVRDTY